VRAWQVVGYTADGEAGCPACAVARYGIAHPIHDRKDREGNAVHPVLAAHEWEYRPGCGACGASLPVQGCRCQEAGSMMRPVRLYLAGPAGSGKTTVAEMLVRDHGFARVSLGGLCREEAHRRGLPEDRAALQAMGDALRGPEPARLAILAWEQARRAPGPLVIDGVRLRAEAEWLTARGVLGVAVLAPDALRIARLSRRDGIRTVRPHATEREALALPVDITLNTSAEWLQVAHRVRLLVARAALLTAERHPAGKSVSALGVAP